MKYSAVNFQYSNIDIAKWKQTQHNRESSTFYVTPWPTSKHLPFNCPMVTKQCMISMGTPLVLWRVAFQECQGDWVWIPVSSFLMGIPLSIHCCGHWWQQATTQASRMHPWRVCASNFQHSRAVYNMGPCKTSWVSWRPKEQILF